VKLYSYVVARDYGFAPNPFFGACTLATCKPMIRKGAAVGDWVVGTGSKGYGLQGRLVYVMNVSETMNYDEYWSDPRYRNKRPNLR
jgi:thiamine monophosphate kinase